jgi:hypothetical protein
MSRGMCWAARLSVLVLAASVGLSVGNLPAMAQAGGGAQTATPAPMPGVKLVDKMPAAAPPRPFVFPKPVSKTLPNGLRVFVVSARARGD